MNCICVTSSGYKDLIPGFQFLWDRYVKFPIQVVMTGDKNRWCADVHSVLQTLNDDPILLVLEDYWNIAPIEEASLELLRNELSRPVTDKVDLETQVCYWAHEMEPTGLVVAGVTAHYKMSTQAAIWRKSFLMRALLCGGSPWEFELQDTDFNGARIVGLPKKTMHYCNVVHKGAIAGYEVDRIQDKDWQDMLAAGIIPERVRAARRVA